jgi:hypothetical protein
VVDGDIRDVKQTRYTGTFICRHRHVDADNDAAPEAQAFNILFGLVSRWSVDAR